MYDRREPILMCATGKKGVGKTYTSMQLIKEYIKAQDTLAKLHSLLTQQLDGYKYLTCTRCYGSLEYGF